MQRYCAQLRAFTTSHTLKKAITTDVIALSQEHNIPLPADLVEPVNNLLQAINNN